jgi:hypothetical protein
MTSRHLPPRDCLVLLLGECGSQGVWVQTKYTAEPLPTWSDAISGEPVDPGDVVQVKEMEEMDRTEESDAAERAELRRRIHLAIDELRTIKRTDDNVSALNKAQGQLEEIWEDLA